MPKLRKTKQYNLRIEISQLKAIEQVCGALTLGRPSVSGFIREAINAHLKYALQTIKDAKRQIQIVEAAERHRTKIKGGTAQ